MRRKVRRAGEDRFKKITIKKLPKRTVFVVHYADGRRTEATHVTVLGHSTISIDPTTKETVIRTEANITLGQPGTCAICGGDTDDQHAHA